MRYLLKKCGIKIDLQVLKISAVVVILFYGVNFSIEYATDTYSTFQEVDTWKWMLFENGRLINAFIYYIIEKLQISNGYIYKMSYMLAIFSLILAVYILGELLCEFCNNKYVCTIVSFLTISNFYVIEYFMFIEKGMFMLAILLCTTAVYFTKEFLEKGKKIFLLFTLGCLLVAVFIYQLMLGLFVVLSLPFIVKFSNNWKSFIKNNILVAVLYIMPMFVAFIVAKFMLNSSRVGEVTSIIDNIADVITIIWMVSWKQWFHIGECLFAVCTLMIIIGVALLSEKIYEKNNICKQIVAIAYIVLGTVFTAFFPKISGIGDIVAPRTLYPYGCLPGIVAMYAIISLTKNVKKKNFIVFSVILTIVLGIQYLNFNSVIVERYRANQNDKYYCEIIGEKIKEYEKESGNVIDTICFYYDKSVKWYDSGCEETTQSPRAQSCGWSNVTALNMYLDKEYVKGECSLEYEAYFEQYNWDTYSEQQVIFNDNVLHLCIY